MPVFHKHIKFAIYVFCPVYMLNLQGQGTPLGFFPSHIRFFYPLAFARYCRERDKEEAPIALLQTMTTE